MAEETTQAPTEEHKTPLTHESAVAKIRKQQEEAFDKADYAERFAVATRKGLKLVQDPSIVPTLDELKAAVTLKRDRMRFIKLAVNHFGLYSVPKKQGRRKPHMSHRQQSIKSAALRIFKSLMDGKAERLKAVCAKEGFDYIGIPDSAVPELAKRAGLQATKEHFEAQQRKRQKACRRQKFSRAVNAGITTTSEKRFVENGGQFGK